MPFPTGCRAAASLLLLAGATSMAPPPARAQEPAILRGVVSEEGSGRPIASARVILTGVGLETRSGEDGTFTFADAPLGRHFLRVQAEGYPAVVQEVELGPGDQLLVPVLVASAAAVIEELVVIARARDRTAQAGATTAADLLALQVPEISVFATNSGRRFPTSLDLRGRGSFTTGEPVVLLDGVRFSGGVGQAMDRLRQVSAADVKSIRVLSGPTSAFLYGAPHGAIYVQTHGRSAP